MANSVQGVAIPATSILGANPQSNGGGWGSWCLAAIQNLLQLPMQFGNAASAFYGYRAKGMQVQAPLPGDMAFFGPSSGNGGQGHVGIVNGDGTYTSVLDDGFFHVLPLQVKSLGADLLGFVSSSRAGSVNPFAALGRLKDRIGGTTHDGGDVVIPPMPGETTPGNVRTPAQEALAPSNPYAQPIAGPGSDPFNQPYTPAECPPKAPNYDNPKYHPDIAIVGGVAGPLLFMADQLGYFGSYAVCAITAAVKFVTTPGYWWRLLFVLAGAGMVVIGARTYMAGELPGVVQSIGGK